MKLLSPMLIKHHKEFTYWYRWEESVFALRIPRLLKNGGTTRTTTFKIQWIWKGKKHEISFCWRPSVTLYYLKQRKKK